MTEAQKQVLCDAYHRAVLSLVDIHRSIRDRLQEALAILEDAQSLLSAAPGIGNAFDKVHQLKLATFLNAQGKLETLNGKELSNLALAIWLVDCELKQLETPLTSRQTGSET